MNSSNCVHIRVCCALVNNRHCIYCTIEPNLKIVPEVRVKTAVAGKAVAGKAVAIASVTASLVAASYLL